MGKIDVGYYKIFGQGMESGHGDYSIVVEFKASGGNVHATQANQATARVAAAQSFLFTTIKHRAGCEEFGVFLNSSRYNHDFGKDNFSSIKQ